ncbi:MAG: phosphodiester glycosidase family protein [Verrucomicrobia bacterium]|nr:phosphodiester glycosidase family protein [Verrucomicrobiota bacterium]
MERPSASPTPIPAPDRPGPGGCVRTPRILLAGLLALWTATLDAAIGGIAFRAAGPGLAVAHVERDEPWSLHVVRVDRRHPGLGFFPSLAFHDRIGLNPLSEQVALFPKALGTAEAAINGDFYALENDPLPGDPRGLFLQRGGLVSAPIARDCLWFDASGAPHIDTVQPRFRLRVGSSAPVDFGLNEDFDGARPVVLTRAASPAPEPWDPRAATGWVLVRDGSHPWLPLAPGRTLRAVVRGPAPTGGGRQEIAPDTLRLQAGPDLRAHLRAGAPVVLETATDPSLATAVSAIGGGPALVHLARPTGKSAARSFERHPRSAFGWNARHAFLVVVDGRQAGLSVGMTLAELSDFLVELGCEEALNLDGGGSTELILGGRILNSPCYGRERATATGLLVVRAPAASSPGPTEPPGTPQAPPAP